MSDCVVVITNPIDQRTGRGISPFEASDADEIVLCCFFRDADQRTSVLADLRKAAGRPETGDEDAESTTSTLHAQYDALCSAGDDRNALVTLVRWRAGVLRGGYHSYSLRDGYAPFRAVALLAFRRLEDDELRYHWSIAREMLDEERLRVMDVFAWGPQL